MSSDSAQRVLLPAEVKPLVYHLHLTPNLDDNTFLGSEVVSLHVNKATNTISVHGLDLEVTKAQVNGHAAKVSYDKHDEVFTFEFEHQLQAGHSASLHVEFKGTLNDKLSGFYRSKYSYQGVERKMATTQFEPVDARRAFPCWDEPAVKAKFVLSLTVPDNLTALSNMPVKSEEKHHGNKTKTVHFGETPIMSTYLLAFIVGEFEHIEGKTNHGVQCRVYTPLGKVDKGKFALDVGMKVLDFFSDYFNIPYPLPKMDMIAICDFAAGAMENWGLITYRETALLCDQTSSVAARSRVAYVVAHELAHQWFGNLVTMDWWEGLWLNEGFATFIGNLAVHQFFPEWQTWTQFVSSYLFSALRLDSLLSSHPIEVHVTRAREIDEIFDAISYSKGAAVLRMIATYIGEAAFQKGLQIYLARHKYGNTITGDLWKALEESSGKQVGPIMNNWTRETGYPVVSVDRNSQGSGCKLHVTQARYLSSGKPTADQDKTTWDIKLPLCSQSQRDRLHFLDLDGKTKDFELGAEFASGWLKANAGQSCVIRVQYSDALAKELSGAVEKLDLPPADRIGLQNDAFALAKAGYLPLAQVFSLAQAYSNETDYSVWSDLSSNLGYVSGILESGEKDLTPLLQKFTRQLYRNVGQRLGWDHKPEQSDLDKLLRSVVLSKLGDNGDDSVVVEAKRRFLEYFKNPATPLLPPDLRAVVFKLVMRNGGEEEYKQMSELFNKAEMPEDKIIALRGIGLSAIPELIKRALEFGMSGAVRNQDVFYMIAACASTPQGRDLTWAYVREHWATIVERFTGGMSMIGHIIKASTDGYATAQAADDVEEFFKSHHADGTQMTVKQVVESIRSNAAFLDRQRDSARAWLTANIA